LPVLVELAIPLQANRIASGLSAPLFAASPPGDPDRLFVLEKAAAGDNSTWRPTSSCRSHSSICRHGGDWNEALVVLGAFMRLAAWFF